MTNRIFVVLMISIAAFVWVAPANAQEPSCDDVSMSVVAVAAREVVDRSPVDLDGPFVADGDPVYVHLTIDNSEGPEQEVTVQWNHLDTGNQMTRNLDVGQSRRWRTWAYHRMRPSQVGDWRVLILDAQGCVLAQLDFGVYSAE